MTSVEDIIDPVAIARQEPDDEKLRQLILYIAKASEEDPYFGSVKLNKLLFYADFLAYVSYGKSITGQEYRKLREGPAPRRLLEIREAMIQAGDLELVSVPVGPYTQLRPQAKRDTDLVAFTAEELLLIDSMVGEYFGTRAADISRDSHTFLGWQLVEENETIPYEYALLAKFEPPESEQAYALELSGRARDYFARGASG